MKKNKAFTLIEVLIAASIIGVISLTILTTFGSGLHVYERVQAYGGVQADVLLALEEIEEDLRNIFPFSTIKFEGDAQRLAFPAIVESLEEEGDDMIVVASIGKVSYYLDDGNDGTKVLMKAQQSYSQGVAEAMVEEGQGQVMVLVKDIQFSYYSSSDEETGFDWKNSWDTEEDGLPAGIKIELTFDDGRRDVPLVRTVFIPSVRVEKGEGKEEGEGEGGEEN